MDPGLLPAHEPDRPCLVSRRSGACSCDLEHANETFAASSDDPLTAGVSLTPLGLTRRDVAECLEYLRGRKRISERRYSPHSPQNATWPLICSAA